MRKIYRRHRPDQNKKRVRMNQYIRVPEVQLIDEEGQYKGVVPTHEALRMAQEVGFELVEINPKARPPIAKIIDYGKYKYDQEKRQKKQKIQQKKTEVKGLRLSFRIGKHDLEVRQKQAIKHLSGGDKLKIEMNLRGRENQHVDIARKTLDGFIDSINTELPVKIEEPIKRAGSKLVTIVARVQNN